MNNNNNHNINIINTFGITRTYTYIHTQYDVILLFNYFFNNTKLLYKFIFM